MSEEPTRLPDDLQALLDAERDAPGPSAASADALWARIEHGLPAAASTLSASGSDTPGAGSVLRRLVHRQLAIGLVVGGAVGALTHAAVRPAHVEVREVVKEVVREVRVEVPVTRTVTVTIDRAPLVAAGKSVRESTRTSSAPPDTALAEERRLIEQARAALARRSAEDAARTLDAHAERYPSGRLAEERDALRVVVMVRLGRREEASELARRFIERYPESVLRPMVQPISDAPRSSPASKDTGTRR
ncbi:hypothetical protein L6R52_33030 [Myxococcota bacterium]|nr:hypothetical protein [Myxococcota bacterium]